MSNLGMNVMWNEDGSLTFEWDEDDPIESQFNEWTEKDFLIALTSALEEMG